MFTLPALTSAICTIRILRGPGEVRNCVTSDQTLARRNESVGVENPNSDFRKPNALDRHALEYRSAACHAGRTVRCAQRPPKSKNTKFQSTKDMNFWSAFWNYTAPPMGRSLLDFLDDVGASYLLTSGPNISASTDPQFERPLRGQKFSRQTLARRNESDGVENPNSDFRRYGANPYRCVGAVVSPLRC